MAWHGHVTSRHVTLRYVMLFYAMLCYVMLCYDMLCYVILCFFPISKSFMAVTAVAEDAAFLQYDAEQIGARNLVFRGNAVSSPSKIIIQPTVLIY